MKYVIASATRAHFHGYRDRPGLVRVVSRPDQLLGIRLTREDEIIDLGADDPAISYEVYRELRLRKAIDLQ